VIFSAASIRVRLGLAVLILITGLVSSSATPVAAVLQSATGNCLSADEAVLLDRLNTHRLMNGLPALTASATLTAAARHHAGSMAEHNYFPGDYSVQHEGPDGDETITWQENIANAGYPDNTHTVRSAIIGAGTDSPSEIYRTLIGLPAYERVLLDRRFAAVGIGFGSNPESDEGTYWALTFGSISDAPIGPCDGVAVQIPIQSGGRSANSASSAVAYDGDFSTVWATNETDAPQNAWLWFDLGAEHELSRIEWMMAEPGIADSFAIDISLDGETWTQVARKGNGATDEWRSVAWRGQARFIRFFFANPNSDPVLGGISEVRFFQ
jgi:uncharacterized protein YkwD